MTVAVSLTLIESKANDDFRLYRDAAFVFSEKIREREASRGFRWTGTYAVMASAVNPITVFCRWCFYEGIDVIDPDRFPLVVLSRLPAFLSNAQLSALENVHFYDQLNDALQLTHEEINQGPMLLRLAARRIRLYGDVLHDLNTIQANLSKSIWYTCVSIRG